MDLAAFIDKYFSELNFVSDICTCLESKKGFETFAKFSKRCEISFPLSIHASPPPPRAMFFECSLISESHSRDFSCDAGMLDR